MNDHMAALTLDPDMSSEDANWWVCIAALFWAEPNVQTPASTALQGLHSPGKAAQEPHNFSGSSYPVESHPSSLESLSRALSWDSGLALTNLSRPCHIWLPSPHTCKLSEVDNTTYL